MDPVRSFTDAVAVRDGRIVALGSSSVRPLVGPGTEVIDLRGRLLLPGFQDAHVHPVFGGIDRLRCDLTGSSGAAECLRRVGSYAQRRPEGGWIIGGGWEMGHFPGGTPTRQALDAVTGDRPAYLVNRDRHGAWVNTAALRIAGVDEHTPDPPHGRVERDSRGRPAGTLHEAATGLVTRVLPPTGTQLYEEGLLEGQRHLHSYGITAWQDAIVGPYLGYDDTLEIYSSLDARGLLTGRVRGALWWDRDRGAVQLDDLLSRRECASGDRFRAGAVKIMQDGVCENLTAALLTPYLDGHGRRTGNRGISHLDAEALSEHVSLLDSAGFQLHFHAVGDRAVREVLDAIGTARRTNGMNDHRHHIAHLQVVHPDDVPRFRELSVAANVQALWAVNDAEMTELTIPFLGPERAGWQYPFRSLRRSGAVLVAGSDWPVSGADPLQAIHTAVNRTEPGSDTEPLLGEQAIDLVDALAAYTTGSAWVNHLDHETGSLRVGAHADLVVLDRDLFSLPAGEICDARVDLTMAGGVVVHQHATS